jgi:hypothetical protein
MRYRPDCELPGKLFGILRSVVVLFFVGIIPATKASADETETPPPACGPGAQIVFFAPGQTCPAWWQPDDTGMPARLSFFPSDDSIVTVVGHLSCCRFG